ncbi:MAG: cold shock domain-containing protein, partial [Flavobacteriaceae bacterium]|nr:cold shock domain-containing protein [Flavobacteriaceae bacterium]
MAKSQQTFNKSEKEKKRLKKREDKRKKMEARKAEAKEYGKKGIEFAYVDHDGNLTDTPPDPALKVEVELESIILGIPKKEEGDEADPVRKGKVSFFDSSKGFGFIIDTENQEKYFTHV